MTVALKVTGDVNAILRDLDRVERRIVPAAAVSALNRTAKQVRTAATRAIASLKNITPQKLVRERLQLRAARRSNMVAIIHAILAGIPLIKIGGGGRRTARGVKVKGRNLEGAFYAVMPTGKRSIFTRMPVLTRHSRGRSKATTPNLPIQEVKVQLQPEATQIIERENARTGGPAWVANMTRELKWRLERKRAR